LYPSNREQSNDYKYIFDLDDYDKLILNTWWLNHVNTLTAKINSKPITIYKFLLKDFNGRISIVKHINNNKLDFRKCNLEIVSKINSIKNRYNPSVIIDIDNVDYIIIIANNTKNQFIFPKIYLDCLRGIGWFENKKGYLAGRVEGKLTLAHHMLKGSPLKGYMVDHIDQNEKNNLENNLRVTTISINSQNRKLQSNNKSGYVGVCWNESSNKWRVSITCNKKQYYLGLYEDKIEGAKIYDNKAIELFGKNATTNKKLGLLP